MINHPILLEVLIRDRRRQLEAIGVTRTTVAVDLPVAVSSTVEIDGRLASDEPPEMPSIKVTKPRMARSWPSSSTVSAPASATCSTGR